MVAQPRPGSIRLLLISIALSLLGVASLLLAPLELLAPPAIDPVAFKWLSLIQPAILAVLAVVIGHLLAHRTGLDAPALRALVTRQPVAPVLVGQIKPGILAGLAAGLVLAAYKTLTEGQIASALELPMATRLLYGGITEEFIARWGLMSLGVWLAAKVIGNGNQSRSLQFWAGNCFAAVLFSIGHIPALLVATPPAWLIMAALAGNFLPALAFGWLFQHRGLEAAVIAHATAHVAASIYLALI